MTKDMGALSGSRASTEPASSLGPSGFDPARIMTLRQIIREVPGRFASVYGRDSDRQSWRGNCTIGDIIGRLREIDVETASPSDIAKIIGNDSWAELECDHCGSNVEAAAVLGEEPDYESRTAIVCLGCLRAAASAIVARQGQDAAERLDAKHESATAESGDAQVA